MNHLLLFSLILALSSPLFSIQSPIDFIIRDAATRAHLDPLLVRAVIQVESNFKQNAQSTQGAMGFMQVMPKTAQEQGIRQPFHASENIMGACQYLRELLNRYRGNLKLALAAYNAGPHRVEQYGGVPPFKETQNYVKKVLRTYHKLKDSAFKQPN